LGEKKLKQSVIVRVAFIFFAGFPSFAFASYDKQCDISFQSYVSPSIAGCIFSAKKSGELSFKLSGRSVTPKKCFSAAGMGNEQINQFIEMIKGDNFVGEKGLLLVREQGDFISGKLTTNSFPNEGMEFPQIKKDFGGSAKATLDTGVSIKLTVKNSVKLALAGDFGTIRLGGPCTKYNASSTSSSFPSTSKLEKAKSTCTELGFTAGTEKHGECVLKMMDN
jgi:hypothetical protein